MSKKKNAVNDLLAAINRQPTNAAPVKTEREISIEAISERAEPVTKKARKPEGSEKKPQSRRGGPVQFWMHDEDRKLVRELYAWLAGQGLRPTDSTVIRAALRMAKTGSALVDAYWDAAKLDGRVKRK